MDKADLEISPTQKAFAIANNAIYFADRSDYLSALYDVCKVLNPDFDIEKIGSKYIDEENPSKAKVIKIFKEEGIKPFKEQKNESNFFPGTNQKELLLQRLYISMNAKPSFFKRILNIIRKR